MKCTAVFRTARLLEIKALNAEYEGEITVQYSYDGETFTGETPMADFLTMELDELYAGLLEAKTITFRFWLAGRCNAYHPLSWRHRNGDDDDAQGDGQNTKFADVIKVTKSTRTAIWSPNALRDVLKRQKHGTCTSETRSSSVSFR